MNLFARILEALVGASECECDICVTRRERQRRLTDVRREDAK